MICWPWKKRWRFNSANEAFRLPCERRETIFELAAGFLFSDGIIRNRREFAAWGVRATEARTL